jgi:amino acid transporter
MTNVPLLRRLSFKESFAIVVGSIIGTGVFLKTAVMAQEAGAPLYVLLAWLVAGVLSFMGALAYAELGCLCPQAGGEYVFLRKAYGPLTGFLYGWTRFWIASSVAFVFSALGAMNGSILTGARVPYAMAQDGLMWSWLGKANARTHSPVGSTIVQGLWACVLAASGTFDQLTNYRVCVLDLLRTHHIKFILFPSHAPAECLSDPRVPMAAAHLHH